MKNVSSWSDSELANLARRLVVRPLRKSVHYPLQRGWSRFRHRRAVPLFWYDSANWGDALSPVLVHLLSGLPVHRQAKHYQKRYLAVGSILATANSQAEVWGSGFIGEDDRVLERPNQVHAVRGPLTRDALLRQGVPCPEVYGDPALLFPIFYNPPVVQRYEIGVIPHYTEKNNGWVRSIRGCEKVCVIDADSGILEYVEKIKACSIVLSSSLHGLISADAYGIPRVWVELSRGIYGGRFKFMDYALSLGMSSAEPTMVDDSTSLAQAASRAERPPVAIDLGRLLSACPFLSPGLRSRRDTLSMGLLGAKSR